ncbi:chorismate mutase [Legionella birminghamensis]|uniref:chorismate mutase n=1 Tax=Legionella birminghamensis TaxID=28083 RepID=A0A378I7S0_9GAMM|nr:chorismate mutase [Legionella birminghamensis]KTC76057.1 chorismate mutase [Legionella birminghamensis]STX30780.1 chorismate mutase [Legionella birminghamensis]
MRAAQYELVRLMQMRMDYVRIIASLKFLLKKPIYVPSVEREQYTQIVKMAWQLNLDESLVKSFTRVLCKISREIQRKLHASWYSNPSACVQFLLNQANHISILQLSQIKNELYALDGQVILIFEQFLQLFRFSIRLIDMQIIRLFSVLTPDFSLSSMKEELRDWYQLSSNALLQKLFILVAKFAKKEYINA